jgi:transposase
LLTTSQRDYAEKINEAFGLGFQQLYCRETVPKLRDERKPLIRREAGDFVMRELHRSSLPEAERGDNGARVTLPRRRRGKEIHVVLNNLNTHKPKQDRWLKAHPKVHFHFTPTHSSWLNQVECWFSILSRGALQGASFTSVKMLIDAIQAFIVRWNEHAIPFEWTKEEVHQQQMKYSYSNLCN